MVFHIFPASIRARAVELLVGSSKETFQDERAIRLFQMQAAAFFPDIREKSGWAAMIAATRLLDVIEADLLLDKTPKTLMVMRELANNEHYRKVFDDGIGRRGGLPELLSIRAPAVLDEELTKRLTQLAFLGKVI